MRNILKKLLSYYGFQISRKHFNIINPNMWSYIKDNDERYNLYNEAIFKANNQHTNNLPKICRHFSLIQCLNFVMLSGDEKNGGKETPEKRNEEIAKCMYRIYIENDA